MSLKSARAVFAVAVTIAAGSVPASAHAVVPFETGSICTVSMDNPHVSTGSGGADAKARFSCERGSMVINEYLINLYLCPQKVSGPESGWVTTYGCRVKASNNGINSHDQPFTVNGSTVTRQVPAPGSSPVHGSGWWVACVQYYRDGGSTKQRAGSTAVNFAA